MLVKMEDKAEGEEEDDPFAIGEEVDIECSDEETDDQELAEARSPYTVKGHQREIREPVPVGPPAVPLPPGFGEEDEEDADDDVTDGDSLDGEDDEGSGDEDDADEGDSDEWVPPPAPIMNKSSRAAQQSSTNLKAASTKNNNTRKGQPQAPSAKLSNLAAGIADLSLSSTTTDDSVTIVSVQKRTSALKPRQVV